MAKGKTTRQRRTGPGPQRQEEGDVLAALDRYPDILTPQETQEILRISRATFFRLVGEGKLPGAVKVGSSWRVVRDKLRAWLGSESESQ